MKKARHPYGRFRAEVFLLLLSVLLSAAAASEQPTITNTGEAVVPVPPGHVEFNMFRVFQSTSLQAASEICEAFLDAAPGNIRGAELQPTEIRVSAPIITSLEYGTVMAVISVRFSMAVFNTPKTGPVQFAILCDKMKALATAMECTLEPFRLLPADEEAVIALAVTRATENAYVAAEAAAFAVKSNIYAVDQVEILDISWEQQPQSPPSDIPQVACRARVRVTYALAPQQ